MGTFTRETQLKGAKAVRDIALKRYYSNPSYCRLCKKLIEVRDNEQPSVTKKKIFCNRSCAATFNNQGVRRHERKPKDICTDCGTEIWAGSTTCRDCLVEKHWKRRCHTKLGDTYKVNTGWIRARQHARDTLIRSGRPKICQNCTWEIYVEVCHIKAISEFSLDTKLKVINALSNLLYLCPNCHKMFDLGLLQNSLIA